MSTILPKSCRPRLSQLGNFTLPKPQSRAATLIPRPKRPYTFTQLITLSDGSTFLHRTTSPQPIHRSTKDTKNTPLWNPSSQKLLNIEEDEAGRLRKFRERFGRGFDVDSSVAGDEAEDGNEMNEDALDPDSGMAAGDQGQGDSLMDLISGYGVEADAKKQDAAPSGTVVGAKKGGGKGKGGKK